MKKRYLIFTIILILIGVFIIHETFYKYNPMIILENVKLDKYIVSIEDAIEIAEQYSLAWDKRVVTGAVSIHYESKDDLINNTPRFWIYSGWTSEYLSDGVTITEISGDTLISFKTSQASVLTPAVPLIKSESYLTNYDFMDFLDELVLENGMNWRAYEDVYVRIRLISNEHFSLQMELDDAHSYSFLYKDGEVTRI